MNLDDVLGFAPLSVCYRLNFCCDEIVADLPSPS